MRAYIYKPAKNAMQSGTAKTRRWLLVFEERSPKFIDPLMGWTGSKDTSQQLRLYFETQEEAEAYARRKGISYVISAPRSRNIRPKSYAGNFAFHRIQYADPQ